MKVFCPLRTPANHEVDIRDTENYYCETIGFDYVQLCQMDRSWWEGLIIEVCGERCTVTDARWSFPTYEWFMIIYKDETGQRREIPLQDAALMFVGHVNA